METKKLQQVNYGASKKFGGAYYRIWAHALWLWEDLKEVRVYFTLGALRKWGEVEWLGVLISLVGERNRSEQESALLTMV